MPGAKCPGCGLVNFDAATSCRRCGTALQMADPWAPGVQQYGSPYGMPAAAYTPSRSGLPVWVKVLFGCLAAVVVVSGIATSFLVMRRISPEWKIFTPPDGSFVVTMPGTPVEQRHVQDSPGGPIVGYSYSIMTLTGDEYMVMYNDFSDQLDFEPEPYSLLDGACNGFESEGFKIIERTPTMVQGHPAYELKLQVPASYVAKAKIAHHYVIWASPRLYQVSVATAREADLESNGRKFIDSFAIMK